jgi:hypothetical protein
VRPTTAATHLLQQQRTNCLQHLAIDPLCVARRRRCGPSSFGGPFFARFGGGSFFSRFFTRFGGGGSPFFSRGTAFFSRSAPKHTTGCVCSSSELRCLAGGQAASTPFTLPVAAESAAAAGNATNRALYQRALGARATAKQCFAANSQHYSYAYRENERQKHSAWRTFGVASLINAFISVLLVVVASCGSCQVRSLFKVQGEAGADNFQQVQIQPVGVAQLHGQPQMAAVAGPGGSSTLYPVAVAHAVPVQVTHMTNVGAGGGGGGAAEKQAAQWQQPPAQAQPQPQVPSQAGGLALSVVRPDASEI